VDDELHKMRCCIRFLLCSLLRLLLCHVVMVVGERKSLHKCVGKVDMRNLITFRIHTPVFEWCVIRCGSRIEYQKDMCLRERDIGLHVQNMIIVVSSIVNIIVEIYMTTY
jgi:hypothetical protein